MAWTVAQLFRLIEPLPAEPKRPAAAMPKKGLVGKTKASAPKKKPKKTAAKQD